MESKVFDPKDLSISIVSHGQGHRVRNLLLDLQPLMQNGSKVLLTINIPENEQYLQDLPCQPEVIRNSCIKGFGENHNFAFSKVCRPWFAVLNPDIRLDNQIFKYLLTSISCQHIGVIAPTVDGPDGRKVVSARHYPTKLRIIYRMVNRIFGLKEKIDYQINKNEVISVDWISGCFMLFSSNSFQLIGGFDTRYFMYLEDADICYRLRLAGFNILLFTQKSIIHEGQYASRSHLRYFYWHLKSLNYFIKNNYYFR